MLGVDYALDAIASEVKSILLAEWSKFAGFFSLISVISAITVTKSYCGWRTDSWQRVEKCAVISFFAFQIDCSWINSMIAIYIVCI